MKRKIVSLFAFFLLVFVICSGVVAHASGSNLKRASDKGALLQLTNLNEDLKYGLSVGDEINLEDYFMPYVTDDTKITYTIEDEEVVYINPSLNRMMALRASDEAGVVITAESDDYYSEFTVKVNLEDFNPDPGFDTIPEGSRWRESNQEIAGWRLYTGGAVVGADQVVELYTDPENGNHMIHYNHPTQYYANLYKDLTDIPAGEYYVEADIEGINVDNTNCFLRLNLNNQYGQTTTTRLSGTFEMGTYTSPVFRVAEGENLRLELYFANNSGEVFFDNVHVYRVISLDHTAFMVEKEVEKLTVGQTAQINCSTVPASTIPFEYSYVSDNEDVATVSKTGLITAKSNGVANITVVDVLEGFKREVLVAVGIENGITAQVDSESDTITVQEDSSNIIKIKSEVSENFTVYPYSDASHGDYYINDNNEIVYNPDANYYTTGTNVDTFEVLVYDAEKGYVVVPVKVMITPVTDEITVIDYWHTTDKNIPLMWQDNPTRPNYDHKIAATVGGDAAGKYGGGYIQVQSTDIEVLYPAINVGEMGSNSTEQQAYRNAKAEAYKAVKGSAEDGSLTITTENGGTVNILYNGEAQEVEDRYRESQGKLIHAIIYNYIPAEGFTGYDHFNMKITKDDKSVVFNNTVYVAPGEEDFNFANVDFNGVYLLSNDEWLEEVRAGYEAGDPYITTWIEYYEAEYTLFIPSGVPASSRTALEQLAILYQVTGDEKYADMCWSQLEQVVKDSEWGDKTSTRLSWGKDSNGFLDAAMVTYSVAFAYNYLSDYLTAEQKDITLRALYEEGFYFFENLNNVNVLLHGNNHCLLVCGNLAVAALSVMNYEGTIHTKVTSGTNVIESDINVREMAADIFSTALKYLQTGLVHYSESGGFPEGPSYSIYAHRNMVNLIATLYNLYGEDSEGNINSFGLWDIEGIRDYINYPLYTSTPNYESFYYAESDYSNNQPALLWYTRIDENNTNAAVLPLLAHQNQQYNIQNLLWYKPGLFDKVDLHNMEETDFLLKNHEIATFRSEFGDEMGLYTGLKGVNDYTNNFSHKNLDSGTFEIYALGERFIGNFSNETYNTVVPDGYWDYDYQRWTYYKKGAQGQNTLVINPDEEPVLTQDPNENAPITRFEANDVSGISVIDLSKVYKAQALDLQRGLMVFDNKTKVMVQDEFNLRKPSTLYWSAHTEARVDILNDKLARLTLNNKSLYVYIASELGTFTKMSGNTPLPGTIGNFCNLNNDGVTKLVIELNDVISGTLSVVFIPSMEEVTDFTSYEVKPISEWALDTTPALPDIIAEDITFSSLDVNKDLGQGYLYRFNPYQYTYLVKLGKGSTQVPDFAVTYDEEKYDLTINKSELFDNYSTITLTDKTTGESRTYYYKIVVDAMSAANEYATYQQVEVAKVSGPTGVENLIDGQNNTSLNANSKQEVIFELADVKQITDILIRFNGGVTKTYYFDIYYSEDGQNYNVAMSYGQNFNGIGDEVYSLGRFDAKYVKIIFYGNNLDDNVNVAEVKLLDNGIASTNDDNNGGNATMWIIIGVVVGVVVIAVVVTTIIIIRKKKASNGQNNVKGENKNNV